MSVVLMHVNYRPGRSELSADEAVLESLGYQDGTTLRSGGLYYQSCNFDAVAPEVWLGELVVLRQSASAHPDRSADGRVIMVREDLVTTEEDRTFFAFLPELEVLALWERSTFNHTKMNSYITKISKRFEFGLRLDPVVETLDVWRMLGLFDRLDRLSVAVRHSNSPGDAMTDALLEQLEAKKLRNVIAADKKGPGLNVEELERRDTEIGRQLEHINQASANGEIIAAGLVGEEELVLKSQDPILRRRAHVPDLDKISIAQAMAAIARTAFRR